MYTTSMVRLPAFCIGKNALSEFAAAASPLGHRFAVIGGHTALKIGMPRLEQALSGQPFTYTAHWYGGECTEQNAARLCSELSGNDFIVGMGGGKAIDTAKYAADLLDIPIISIPTLVSNCAPITALSVVYSGSGSFESFRFYDAPPACTIIDLSLAMTAPGAYFRAGLCDAMSKYPEASFSARGDILGQSLDHMSYLGVTLSRTCWDPIMKFGVQALSDWENGLCSPAVELCTRSIIISAGLVSLLADDNYNCAVAHSVCYGLQSIPRIENTCLHGDLVAYGMLVQLCLDQQLDEAVTLHAFLQSLGVRVTLREMDIPLDRTALDAVLSEAVSGPDMQHIPYSVSKDDLYQAMQQAELLPSERRNLIV